MNDYRKALDSICDNWQNPVLDDRYNVLSEAIVKAELLDRFLKDPDVWKDIEFGTDNNKFYIDGVIEYKSDNEKRIIKETII